MIDDLLVASYLDDTWRTPSAVQRLLKRGVKFEVCEALRRLALAGAIEKREDLTAAPKYRKAAGPAFKIEFYRRLQ